LTPQKLELEDDTLLCLRPVCTKKWPIFDASLIKAQTAPINYTTAALLLTNTVIGRRKYGHSVAQMFFK
jgi:hypothetical protein